jgi:uracil phosphoribosyltransferase
MSSSDIFQKYPGKFLLIRQTPQVIALTTIIRDQKTNRGDFVFYSDRLFRLLMEEALAYCPYSTNIVSTPLSTESKKVQFKVWSL